MGQSKGNSSRILKLVLDVGLVLVMVLELVCHINSLPPVSPFFFLLIFMLSRFSYVIDVMLHHMNSLV